MSEQHDAARLQDPQYRAQHQLSAAALRFAEHQSTLLGCENSQPAVSESPRALP